MFLAKFLFQRDVQNVARSRGYANQAAGRKASAVCRTVVGGGGQGVDQRIVGQCRPTESGQIRRDRVSVLDAAVSRPALLASLKAPPVFACQGPMAVSWAIRKTTVCNESFELAGLHSSPHANHSRKCGRCRCKSSLIVRQFLRGRETGVAKPPRRASWQTTERRGRLSSQWRKPLRSAAAYRKRAARPQRRRTADS